MRRVLLHLGLHKTGTTAAQSFLYENRELIWPHFSLALPYKTRKAGLSEAATRHSIYRLDSTLSDFGIRMNDFLGKLDFGTRRGLILSEENFSGLRPSRNRVEGYAAAPDLVATVVSAVHRRFLGEEVDMTVYLSLRQRDSWLYSLWAHDLQHSRVVRDFDEFCADLDHLPDLQGTADTIRKRLPSVTVQTAWLEDLQKRQFGPGAPFAEFLDLSQSKALRLVAPDRTNSSPSKEVLADLLALNRSSLEDAALNARKKAVVETSQSEMIGQK
ncbi:hypothetical protein [uncultured Ruegeria sp.]|uniref:hypothetical protein n=1 Tax=uncultured Ruegeria sp. TaxID=259304 RepID=UPI00262E0222|nr:hypothetical protein [uncultured Ruegeria sp.]